jgi:hypothetical protein
VTLDPGERSICPVPLLENVIPTLASVVVPIPRTGNTPLIWGVIVKLFIATGVSFNWSKITPLFSDKKLIFADDLLEILTGIAASVPVATRVGPTPAPASFIVN